MIVLPIKELQIVLRLLRIVIIIFSFSSPDAKKIPFKSYERA
jgi:hypothetical protein